MAAESLPQGMVALHIPDELISDMGMMAALRRNDTPAHLRFTTVTDGPDAVWVTLRFLNGVAVYKLRGRAREDEVPAELLAVYGPQDWAWLDLERWDAIDYPQPV